MGYLDHSTNNIILDAVLTDYGRSKLASSGTAQGGFNITKFAFGDDEVDYTIIKKYGRTVGKEKIEKNTPIFEALTNESIALKYKLIGLSQTGQTLQTTRLPVIDTNTNTLSLSSAATTGTVNVTLRYRGATATATDLSRDFSSTASNIEYAITLSSRFLTLNGATSSSAPLNDANRTRTYKYRTSTNSFDLNFAVNTIDTTTLQVYGKKDSSSYTIATYVTIECLDVPAVSKTFSVTYTASA